ncbi:MAG: sporulation protein YqfD [Clostridia bacterium]|nr:sporulation protein YqfD [Clostridia bacterium]
MKPSVTFEIFGLNQLKLINAFRLNGITVSGLNRVSQKQMILSVHYAFVTKAKELMDNYGFSYEILHENSFKKLVLSLLGRVGLIVGMVIVVVLAIIAKSFLWKIDIEGNSSIDELAIIKALKNSGIFVGCKNDFDKELVEESLLALDEISAVSVRKIGTTLRVEILESSHISAAKQAGDIVSLYDAEIVRIVINSGSAKVRIGDRVSIGTTLIEGWEYDTEGNPLMQVTAQGEIFGKVNFTYSEIASLDRELRIDEPLTNTTLQLFGLTIGKEPLIDYRHEKVTTKTKVGSILPLYAKTTKYYKLVSYEITLDELIKSVTDKAINNLIINAGSSPITTTASAKLIAENVYRITVHIEAEVSIGGKKVDENFGN